MSSPLPNLDGYWQALSASPVVQTLEGQGVQPKFDEVKPAAPSVQSPRLRFDNNI